MAPAHDHRAAMAPRVDSLSNHRIGVGDPLRSIFVYGSGFRDVTGVQVGDAWAESLQVDGESIITVALPHLTAGTTNWVIVHTLDGSSPCEGDGQLLTVDDLTDVPPAELRLDGMEPATIALGRADTYWLSGSGLSQVTMAHIGGTACRVESYDDNRLVLYIPEAVDGGSDGATVEVEVFAPHQSATLRVSCSAPVAPHEDGWPVVTGVEPTRLGVEGGRIVVQGVRLDRVMTVTVGPVTCQVESASAGSVTAVVPSLEGHRGETLEVAVADFEWASPSSSVAITVDG
jgi:hypothetical protein